MKKLISTPSRTKKILDQFNLRAKKGFGQNFLVDPVIVEKCASMAHAESAVIEIGPGIGSLTEALCMHAKKVIAFEVDKDLMNVLADTLSDYDNVEVILQDFLECDLEQIVTDLKQQYGSVSVCANLPYYITTPVLFKIFENPDISYITVMVQKEVGDRFAAKPNDTEYSALSVEGQYLFDIKKLFTVPGRSFNPSPAVDSVIIQFSRKENDKSNQEIQNFFTLVRACFKQRRKTIYNNLKEYLQDGQLARQALEKAEIPSNKRAQQLSIEELERLFEVLQ